MALAGLPKRQRQGAGVTHSRGGGYYRAALAFLLSAGLLVASLVPASAAFAFPRLVRKHHRPTPAAASTTVPGTTLVTSLPVPAPPPSAPADVCLKGSWDAAVEGMPATFAVGTNSAYLWYDADGAWALRFTHAGPSDKLIFAGYVKALSGQFVDVSPMSKGGTDIVAVSPDKRTIYFRFVDFGLLDGLNFATHCTRAITVNVHAGNVNSGGPLLPTGQIHLGATATSPPANPFKVGRGLLLAARGKQPA
jgi:hypothetical protein